MAVVRWQLWHLTLVRLLQWAFDFLYWDNGLRNSGERRGHYPARAEVKQEYLHSKSPGEILLGVWCWRFALLFLLRLSSRSPWCFCCCWKHPGMLGMESIFSSWCSYLKQWFQVLLNCSFYILIPKQAGEEAALKMGGFKGQCERWWLRSVQQSFAGAAFSTCILFFF